MFEVHLMVEDNKLTKLLWALDGLIADQPKLIPVRGAKAVKTTTGPKVVANTEVREGTILDRFTKQIVGQTEDILTTNQLKDIMETAGGKRPSTPAATFRLQELGLLKKAQRGRYQVNRRGNNE